MVSTCVPAEKEVMLAQKKRASLDIAAKGPSNWLGACHMVQLNFSMRLTQLVREILLEIRRINNA